MPVEGAVRRTVPLTAGFRQDLTLNASPTKALLTLSAFKAAAVFINGNEVAVPFKTNWKDPATADVASQLHVGTNELTVWVTNSIGPPALWLRIEMNESVIATDTNWSVSLAGSPWESPRLATEAPEIQSSSLLFGREKTIASLAVTWPFLTATCLIALTLIITAFRLHSKGINLLTSRIAPPQRIYVLLALVLIARAALFIHNLPLLPPTMGFDAKAHGDYVAFILEKHRLPLSTEGWEMHQPPLYYAIGAFFLDTTGHSLPDERATLILRVINGMAGLIQCWLVFKCLRLLFPDNHEAQAIGLLFGAFLPPQLLLSQYVTNDPMVWLLATLAFFLSLRALGENKYYLWLYLGMGAVLGAALLAKLTAMPIIPVFLVALAMHQLQLGSGIRKALQHIGVVVCSSGIVVGWYYWRTWNTSGMGVLPNWEQDPASAWWQEPGFHTLADCSRFGRALTTPLFSGFNGVWDGLYTTFWGDGLASGTVRLAFRPPWNYDLMNAAYLLALFLTLLVGIGLVIAIARFIAKPTPQGLLMFGPVIMLALGVFYVILRSPAIGAIKAFYLLPALVSFCALFALGWSWLVQAGRWVRICLWTVLVVWLVTVYSTFRVHRDTPQTHLVRGICQMEFNKDAEAIESLSRALSQNSDARKSFRRALPDAIEADAHFSLGLLFDRQGNATEAVRQYRQALQIKGDFIGAANNLAWILASSSNEKLRNGAEAVKLAELACELTKYQKPVLMGTLAAAYAEAGRFAKAVTMAKRATDRAAEEQQDEVAKRNGELMNLYQSGKPVRDQ